MKLYSLRNMWLQWYDPQNLIFLCLDNLETIPRKLPANLCQPRCPPASEDAEKNNTNIGGLRTRMINTTKIGSVGISIAPRLDMSDN